MTTRIVTVRIGKDDLTHLGYLGKNGWVAVTLCGFSAKQMGIEQVKDRPCNCVNCAKKYHQIKDG